MIVGKLVRYEGRVQGVGFRFATQNIAKAYNIAGYVRNLPTGEVELLAEGEADKVDAFLSAVASHMAGYIQRETVQDQPPQSLTDFRIRA